MAKQGYKNRIRVVLADRQVTNRALADMMGVNGMFNGEWKSQNAGLEEFINLEINK